ncbi:unnamed protein product [Rotaria sp. Silwood1]|nr:unnamed protein product [Rotaria sp. Silwood1]CAF1628950.1 unnamed protein product [Rotaria sp. Silwood1]
MLYEHYYLFLLINSHAFTIIGIELLKDFIQHSTSSYVLAKFALAQLIDDIDFRILTYLEQQQLKQQYPDIRVRQATASTFANLRKYINTNESDFQAAVLDLLVQLLLIRVNYTSGHEPETHVGSHLFVSEGIHLYESGLTLVLLIEQFLPLPLNKQLLPKYIP